MAELRKAGFGIGSIKRRQSLISDLPTSFMATYRSVDIAANLVNINLVYSTDHGTSSVLLRDIPLEAR